jgi:hypothetical protein
LIKKRLLTKGKGAAGSRCIEIINELDMAAIETRLSNSDILYELPKAWHHHRVQMKMEVDYGRFHSEWEIDTRC